MSTQNNKQQIIRSPSTTNPLEIISYAYEKQHITNSDLQTNMLIFSMLDMEPYLDLLIQSDTEIHDVMWLYVLFKITKEKHDGSTISAKKSDR